MRTWLVIAGWMLSMHAAGAQKIASAGSGQITGVTQNVRAGTVARGPGGESAGTAGAGSASGHSSVVSGKVAGYGARAMTGMSESVYQGSANFGFNASRDFPESDFVATMPLPAMPGGDVAASGFGVTLSGAGYSGRGTGARPGSHHSGGARPVIRVPGAVANPFTHTIGGNMGQLGSAPTVLGAATH